MQKYRCSICGFVTENKGEKHPCGRIEAIIHHHDENPERSVIDGLIRKIVAHIQAEITIAFRKHPDEFNRIHPRMLINLMLTNIILNMFMDGMSPMENPKIMQESLIAVLEDISELAMNGLNALIAATASTETPN